MSVTHSIPASSGLHKCKLSTTTTPAIHTHTEKKEQFFLLRHLGLPVISACDLPLLLEQHRIRLILFLSDSPSKNIKTAVMSPKEGQILESLKAKRRSLDLTWQLMTSSRDS